MPKVSEAHLEARREQILSAAATCFARNGFHGCTMQDICREAELSPGAIYRYFRSKEEIIAAMGEEEVAQMDALIASLQQAGGTRDVLERLAAAYFGKLEHPEECSLDLEMWAESVRNQEFRRIIARSFEMHAESLASVVRAGQDGGEINPALRPEAVAQVLISLFEGLLLQKVLNSSVDVQQYGDVARAIINGLFWQVEGAD